jgi:hypothetical protein
VTNGLVARVGADPDTNRAVHKTGDANLETAYARHFVWPGKQAFKPPSPAADAA